MKGLVIANEKLKSHAQIHDEIYDRYRRSTNQTLQAMRSVGLLERYQSLPVDKVY